MRKTPTKEKVPMHPIDAKTAHLSKMARAFQSKKSSRYPCSHNTDCTISNGTQNHGLFYKDLGNVAFLYLIRRIPNWSLYS